MTMTMTEMKSICKLIGNENRGIVNVDDGRKGREPRLKSVGMQMITAYEKMTLKK